MDSRIRPGMTVVSSDGIALGKVRRREPDGIVISGGAIVHGEHRVDATDVRGVSDGELYLRRRAAEVAAAPPEAPRPVL